MQSNSETDESEISDTDDELQRAYQRNELKPGLFRLVPQKEKIRINNVTGLQSKLAEFQLNLPWIERFDVVNNPAPLAPELAKRLEMENEDAAFVENEFKREIQFYRQAQAAVLEAIPKIYSLGVKTKRPNDYFAQMVKSDDHMKKVRELLLNQQTVMERKEKLKKLREMKKYGKQVQQEVLQKRVKEKKEMLDSVKKFRKNQKNRSDPADGLDSKAKAPTKKPNKKASNKPNKKLQSRKDYKDKKFGFGGQKKKSKFNDKESFAEGFGPRGKKNRPQQGGNKRKQGFGQKKKPSKGRRKMR